MTSATETPKRAATTPKRGGSGRGRKGGAATPQKAATPETPKAAPKPTKVTFSFERRTARGDWYAIVPASALSEQDLASGYVKLSGEAKEIATVRYGGACGAMIVSLPPKEQQAVAIASIAAMTKLVKDGYKTDARKGAVASPATAIVLKAAKNLAGGAAVRKKLRAIPASQRSEKAQEVLQKARDGK